MKKVLSSFKRNSLLIVSMCALYIGTIAATPATLFGSQQPKCPEDLLK